MIFILKVVYLAFGFTTFADSMVLEGHFVPLVLFIILY